MAGFSDWLLEVLCALGAAGLLIAAHKPIRLGPTSTGHENMLKCLRHPRFRRPERSSRAEALPVLLL